MVDVTTAVWRAWRGQDTEHDIALLVKTGLPTDEGLHRVRAICDELDLRDVNGDDLAELYAAPLPQGTGLWVANCDELEPVLDLLSQGLVPAGLDTATITTLPVAEVGVPDRGLAFLKCEWAMRGVPVFFPDVPGVEASPTPVVTRDRAARVGGVSVRLVFRLHP